MTGRLEFSVGQGMFRLVSDEVGMAYGAGPDFRSRTTFQPVFSAGLRGTSIFGLRAGVRFSRQGAAIEPRCAIAGHGREAGMALNRLVRAVHAANFRQLDGEGISLILEADPGLLENPAGELALLRSEVGTGSLVIAVSASSILDTRTVIAFAAACRDANVALLLTSVSSDPDVAGLLDAVGPDIVAFDRKWLAMTAADPRALDWLRVLFHRLRDRGCATMAECPESVADIDIALDVGVALLAGDAIGKTLAAGSFELSEITVPHLMLRQASRQSAGRSA